MNLRLKRAYDPVAPSDGFRVLVDRLWPRGVQKDALHINLWMKEVSPSSQLRAWFSHDPTKWDEFQRRYFQELDHNQTMLTPLFEASKQGNVTLIYSAKDTEHNNAVCLKRYLEMMPPQKFLVVKAYGLDDPE